MPKLIFGLPIIIAAAGIVTVTYIGGYNKGLAVPRAPTFPEAVFHGNDKWLCRQEATSECTAKRQATAARNYLRARQLEDSAIVIDNNTGAIDSQAVNLSRTAIDSGEIMPNASMITSSNLEDK